MRARAANGFGSGRGLTVVSADIIAGSATAKLLALKDETLIGRRLEQVERLPTSDDVAAAVQTAVLDSRLGEKTNTIHVWEPDAYYLGSPIPKQNDLKGRA